MGVRDTGYEILAATTAGTSITASYSGGVLSLSGVADVSEYQAVLRTVRYSDAADYATLGIREISVVVNDGINTSDAATTTMRVIQGSAPSGYTIAVDHSVVNAANAANAGFTFAGATVGTTYRYTVTSSGGGSVTGNGTVTSVTQDITGINVWSLSDGTLSYSVTLTNAQGFTGLPATATALLDKTARAAIRSRPITRSSTPPTPPTRDSHSPAPPSAPRTTTRSPPAAAAAA